MVQDTGFSRVIPTGAGLVAFDDLDGAVAGLEQIARDPDRHATAARALAAECFDSDVVLADLIERALA